MNHFWHDYLYTPLLNILFYLYSGPAMGNFGIAIVQMTVLLRVALLPFTLVDESNRYRYAKLDRKIGQLERDFKGDHVMRDQRIRELLKEQKVSYWSKVIALGAQLVVLVLLYQVFLGGIQFTGKETIYSWVNPPGKVQTMFLGSDVKLRSAAWAGGVAVLLFMQIYSVQKQREHLIKRSDVMYLFLFPIFTFFALWMLPMSKSLFVLTSMLFSMVVFALRSMLFKVPAADAAPKAAAKAH